MACKIRLSYSAGVITGAEFLRKNAKFVVIAQIESAKFYTFCVRHNLCVIVAKEKTIIGAIALNLVMYYAMCTRKNTILF